MEALALLAFIAVAAASRRSSGAPVRAEGDVIPQTDRELLEDLAFNGCAECGAELLRRRPGVIPAPPPRVTLLSPTELFGEFKALTVNAFSAAGALIPVPGMGAIFRKFGGFAFDLGDRMTEAANRRGDAAHARFLADFYSLPIGEVGFVFAAPRSEAANLAGDFFDSDGIPGASSGMFTISANQSSQARVYLTRGEVLELLRNGAPRVLPPVAEEFRAASAARVAPSSSGDFRFVRVELIQVGPAPGVDVVSFVPDFTRQNARDALARQGIPLAMAALNEAQRGLINELSRLARAEDLGARIAFKEDGRPAAFDEARAPIVFRSGR